MALYKHFSGTVSVEVVVSPAAKQLCFRYSLKNFFKFESPKRAVLPAKHFDLKLQRQHSCVSLAYNLRFLMYKVELLFNP